MINLTGSQELDKESFAFLRAYLTSNPTSAARLDKNSRVIADYFCADQKDADTCAELVRTGEKRATCGLALMYEIENVVPLKVGDLLIVQNWYKQPIAIVELTEVRQMQFGQIDAAFAQEEGEGDKSYVWWRKTHWDFFSRELAEIGREMSDDMDVITERFKKVWPA